MKSDFFKIRKANGKFETLMLAIPETEEEYNTGLANRDSIPENTGMLYIYSECQVRKVSMYTPETRVPVDFIFINDTGAIIKIHKNAKPLCRDIISCYFTTYVIELAGGECDRLNINVGDVLVLNTERGKQLFTSPDYLDGIFYYKNGTYFCKNKDDFYMYSYPTHIWTLVEENVKWRFWERNLFLESVESESMVSKDFAKEQCIKRDKELLDDLKKNLKYFYKLSDKLFLIYDYKINCFQYYSYRNGWVNIEDVHYFPYNSYDFYNNIRWFSIIKTKNEVFENIENINKYQKKRDLYRADKENEKIINKLKNIMHPFCRVFYKDDDIEGWKAAIIPGRKLFVEEQCKKFQLQKNWKDYWVFGGSYCGWALNIDFDVIFNPLEIHTTTNWLYNPATKRYFILPDERLPLPKNKTKNNGKIEFFAEFDELTEYDINREDKSNLYDLTLNLTVKLKEKSYSVSIDYGLNKNEIKRFFKEIESCEYSQLIVDEYNSFKAFIWKIDKDKIRFQIQNWDSKVEIPIDIEYDEKEFIKLTNKLEREINRKEKLCIDKINNKQEVY